MDAISKLISKLSSASDTEVECHLFSLPLELREEIWYLSLPRSIERELYDDEQLDGRPYNGTRSFKLPVWEPGSLDILRVNRQIYEEAMPMFWKRNSFTLFVRGRDSRLALAFAQKEENGKPIQHLRRFSTIDPEYSKMIRRWSLSFDTGYSGNTQDTVTKEKAVWDSVKRIMPPRITEHALASQYLPFRFITRLATCDTDQQSRLSYKQSAFAHLLAFLDGLSFAPDFRILDLGVGDHPGADLSGERFSAQRCQHLYMYKSIHYRPGEVLMKLLPNLIQADAPPVTGSAEDRAWDWLELEPKSDSLEVIGKYRQS
jgi:hypothetical protein